jgi:hypothetical protein
MHQWRMISLHSHSFNIWFTMFSMRYDLSKLPIQTLLRPMSDAAAGLARLDERVAGSSVGEGWIGRAHFTDACASLWVDGELVHLEDLVLHDAGHDTRTPTHELTIARDVLRMRRRIATHPPGWALSAEGLRSLRSAGQLVGPDAGSDAGSEAGQAAAPEVKGADAPPPQGQECGIGATGLDALDAELAALDAVLARTGEALTKAATPRRSGGTERDPLLYDLDWDEDERLEEWRIVVGETEAMSPVLRAVVLLDAWNSLQVLQHAPWLGRLLAGASLRQSGLTTNAHLTAFNLGLREVPVERRRHPGRNTRLIALLGGLQAAIDIGMKEHDRLTLARQMMERRLVGRRSSSKLPQLVELVMAKPLVSASMISSEIGVTTHAAIRLVQELDLREMTGRGRFRAWGVR